MSDSPTIEQIWQRYDATEQRLTACVSGRMLELGHVQPGMRVLDLATGRGEPAIAAAGRVGPTGRVIGVDLSSSMLDMTRQRAEAAGLENIQLMVGDAQTLEAVTTADFDVVLSRWGLMYMPDPVMALKSARQRCKPKAKLVAALWAEPQRVDYVHVPCKLASRYLELPQVVADQPGTFRLADPAVIQRDFAAAGWHLENIDELYVPVMEVDTPDELVHWCECFGMNRLMQGVPEEKKAAWRDDLRAQFASLCNQHGQVQLGGVTRLVTCTSMRPN